MRNHLGATLAGPRCTEVRGLAKSRRINNMKRNLCRVVAGVCALALSAIWALPARAQSDAKEKPPMYSYVSFWNIPRAQWAEMAKADAADQEMLKKAVANGTLVGYGNDTN